MSDPDAPTDLEMELRRNLTPCRCKHVFLDHISDPDDPADLMCEKCKCPAFRERF